MRSSICAAVALLMAASPVCATDDVAIFREVFLAGDLPWAEVQARAEDENEVTFYHSGDDDLLNRWIDDVAVPAMARRGVTLRPVRLVDTREAVDLVLAEIEAGRLLGAGSVDVIWLNGENFATLKAQDALFGGFAPLLPQAQANVAFDPDDPAAAANLRDFGVETGGAQVPWSSGQHVCAANAALTDARPATFEALRSHLEANPGRFTYVRPPHYLGNTFAQAAIYALNPDGTGAAPFQEDAADIDPAELARLIAPAIDWLAGIEPLLAGQGDYPEDGAALDRLFLDGAVDFACRFGIYAAATEAGAGLWPERATHFVFPTGAMIRNKSFLAIPSNAPNPAAALVLANWMTSVEAQASKLARVGYPAGIDITMLSEPEIATIEAASPGLVGITREQLDANAAPDTNASLVAVIETVWLEVIGRGNPAPLAEIVAETYESLGIE